MSLFPSQRCGIDHAQYGSAGLRNARLFRAGLALGLAFFLTGCLHHRRQRATVPGVSGAGAYGRNEMQGLASWYGVPYNGRPTANGEIYNMYAMTAAHRMLPFGTRVRVHDLTDGRTVDVRINDRGPFIPGRIIDLSYAAAEAIDMVGRGADPVRLEILNPELVSGPAATPGLYAVQVGAFRDPANAQRLKALIEPHFGPVIIQTYHDPKGVFYRVRVGNLNNETTARELASEMKQARLAAETYVVRLN